LPWAVAGGALAFTAASLLGRLDWRLSLLGHFRLHLTAGCLCALPLTLAASHRGPAAMLGGALAANVGDVILRELGRAGRRPPQTPTGNIGETGDRGEATLVSFNALRRNSEKREALDWLRRCGADVMVILEVSSDWRQALLDNLADDYPYHELGPDSHDDRIMILSRYPLRRKADSGLDNQGLLMVHVAVRGREFTLIGIHPDHAIERRSVRPQRALFSLVADLIRDIAGPVAVAGDLNTTPWSSEFQRFLDATGLDAPLLRRGTFPAGLGWAGLPIDHVLAGQGLRLETIEPGPDIGSDHRPVVARLAHVAGGP
jgi:endonuclease/exonuclease/phosphatase (EEP) superfamily protein YafD